MKSSLLAFILILQISLLASAYVPKTNYILDRVSTNHGSGIYVIDQNVTLYGPNTPPVTLKEQWLIENGKKLRMRVTGKNEFKDHVQFTFLYSGKKRYTVDSKGVKRVTQTPEDFFEPLFYFKSVDFIKNFLHKSGVIPRTALYTRPAPTNIEKIKHDTESFVRLSRASGTVNYTLGEKPSSAESKYPTLWIEQDYFHIRKFRSPDLSEVKADKYQRHRNNLWLPQTREIRWGENRATITVSKVKNYSKHNNTLKKRLSSISMNINKEPSLIAVIPENSLIADFYKQFR